MIKSQDKWYSCFFVIRALLVFRHSTFACRAVAKRKRMLRHFSVLFEFVSSFDIRISSFEKRCEGGMAACGGNDECRMTNSEIRFNGVRISAARYHNSNRKSAIRKSKMYLAVREGQLPAAEIRMTNVEIRSLFLRVTRPLRKRES